MNIGMFAHIYMHGSDEVFLVLLSSSTWWLFSEEQFLENMAKYKTTSSIITDKTNCMEHSHPTVRPSPDAWMGITSVHPVRCSVLFCLFIDGTRKKK